MDHGASAIRPACGPPHAGAVRLWLLRGVGTSGVEPNFAQPASEAAGVVLRKQLADRHEVELAVGEVAPGRRVSRRPAERSGSAWRAVRHTG